MPTRPPLDRHLDSAEFLDWYWTLAELRAGCRALGLPAGGDKQTVAARIAACLAGRAAPPPPPRPRGGPMPASFTPDTVIGPGWRCTQALRAHLRTRLGPAFTFTEPVRRFLTEDGLGRPLHEVDAVWRASRGRRPGSVDEIAAVFDYNRFRHRHRAAHPAASGAEVAVAWQSWKDTPHSARG